MRKLCSQDAGNRYASVLEVQKALKSDWSAVAGIVFILLVAAVALVPIFDRWFRRPAPATEPAILQASEPSPFPVAEPVEAPADTTPVTEPVVERDSASVILNEVKNLPPTKKTAPSTKKTKTTDPRLIDELFRQATELFE